MGFADLLGTGRDWKIQNKNMSPAGFEPATFRIENQSSALGRPASPTEILNGV